MSDRIYDISKAYQKNVCSGCSKSNGLFPIPEHLEPPKRRDNGMWSSAYEIILTTLRYLAPATLLTLFWGQQSLIFRLLKHIDLAIKSIVYSSDEQRQSVLKWLEEAGPVKVEHLETVWRHGWILCGVLDSALPGACAGHPPTRLTLKHAQSIADDYLDVQPVFSHQELESNDALGKRQEWKLAQYLDRIREAIGKLTPPVSKPSTPQSSPKNNYITMDYVSRGSGLTAAQVNNKMYFKIYPTAQQSIDPGEIMVLIKGPKDIYGMTVIPPLPGKAQMIRQKLLGLQGKKTFTEIHLPITQGAAYLRAYRKNDMNKTFHIPKTTYDIDIDVEIRSDCARIGYIVPLEGKYEIYITSKGSNIVGSPYAMTASKNILEILEKDSFCLEDGEEIDILDVKTDRRVILRIVDFVTEKMLLKENGTFEKISEEEAKLLMSMDIKEREHLKEETPVCNQLKNKRFKDISTKVKVMLNVCNIFKDLKTKNIFSKTIIKKDIPDIVNSTFNDINVEREQIPQLIIPSSLTLLLKQERIKMLYDSKQTQLDINKSKEIHSEEFDKFTSNNPFHNCKNKTTKDTPIIEHNDIQKHLNDNIEIKITVDEDKCDSPIKNPFVDLEMERPKTPILKIITGQLDDRADSPYIDKTQDLEEEDYYVNEFLNPLFVHEHRNINTISPSDKNGDYPTADFIIGAPVSLPPFLKASSPEPDMDSIILASNLDEALYKYEIKVQTKPRDVNNTKTSSDAPDDVNNEKNSLNNNDNMILNDSIDNLTYHSLDSNFDNESLASSERKSDSFGEYCLEEITYINQDNKSKKETWDSAYVSIDDNCSSDNISNEDGTNELQKQKGASIEPNLNEYLNMGPAERELWQSCKELGNDDIKINEQVKTSKWDFKRHIFTPIIEESDRSLSTGLKDSIGPDRILNKDDDSVTKPQSEINELLQEHPEIGGFKLREPEKHNKEVEYILEENVIRVDSASGNKSDVMRQRKHIREETISEVQEKVTEFLSASRALHDLHKDLNLSNNEITSNNLSNSQIQIGEDYQANFVLERKKYWDEKIRVIEESTSHKQHKKSILKNQNYSYKKKEIGKQKKETDKIIGENNIIDETKINTDRHEEVLYNKNVKLVEKWKKFWDEKLITENDASDIKQINNKESLPTNPVKIMSSTFTTQLVEVPQIDASSTAYNISDMPYSQITGKQEIAEEVFKAFETSPKRFFGTSRKNIINKLDLFLPTEEVVQGNDKNQIKMESGHGIVSSRITQFHSIKLKNKELNRNNRVENQKSIINVLDPNHIKCENNRKLSLDKSSLSDESDNDAKNIMKRLNNIKTIQEYTDIKKNVVIINKNHKDLGEYKDLEEPKLDQNITKTIIKRLNDIPFANNKTVSTNQNPNNFTQTQSPITYKTNNRKLSASKSEMDIFNKVATSKEIITDTDKYKSCEELPKNNVKNVISLYETVSKNSISTDINTPPYKLGRIRTFSINDKLPDTRLDHSSANTGLDVEQNIRSIIPYQDFNLLATEINKSNVLTSNDTYGSFAENKKRLQECFNVLNKFKQNKIGPIDTIITDIDIEIIENVYENEDNISSDKGINETDYKSRFKLAKEYFQSIEDLRQTPEKKFDTVINCEIVNDTPKESLKEKNTNNKKNKKKVKSHSLPSSEFANIWNQMQEHKIEIDTDKYVKISEKFNVDDLFNDVVGEGRLSRQGSFKGIPHKKAVLQMFKSMENISDKCVNSYDIAVTQLADYAKEKNIKNVQTYLTEYPYLPTTDPSKYHSRRDAKASGLISRREMLNNKPRRNSVPDLRMNAKFIVNL